MGFAPIVPKFALTQKKPESRASSPTQLKEIAMESKAPLPGFVAWRRRYVDNRFSSA